MLLHWVEHGVEMSPELHKYLNDPAIQYQWGVWRDETWVLFMKGETLSLGRSMAACCKRLDLNMRGSRAYQAAVHEWQGHNNQLQSVYTKLACKKLEVFQWSRNAEQAKSACPSLWPAEQLSDWILQEHYDGLVTYYQGQTMRERSICSIGPRSPFHEAILHRLMTLQFELMHRQCAIGPLVSFNGDLDGQSDAEGDLEDDAEADDAPYMPRYNDTALEDFSGGPPALDYASQSGTPSMYGDPAAGYHTRAGEDSSSFPS